MNQKEVDCSRDGSVHIGHSNINMNIGHSNINMNFIFLTYKNILRFLYKNKIIWI